MHHLNNTSKTVQEKRALSVDSFPGGLASVRFQACSAMQNSVVFEPCNFGIKNYIVVITLKQVGLLFKNIEANSFYKDLLLTTDETTCYVMRNSETTKQYNIIDRLVIRAKSSFKIIKRFPAFITFCFFLLIPSLQNIQNIHVHPSRATNWSRLSPTPYN